MRSHCSIPNSEHNVLAKLKMCHMGSRIWMQLLGAAEESPAPRHTSKEKFQNLAIYPSLSPKGTGLSLGCGLLYFFVYCSVSGNLASASQRTEVPPRTYFLMQMLMKTFPLLQNVE